MIAAQSDSYDSIMIFWNEPSVTQLLGPLVGVPEPGLYYDLQSVVEVKWLKHLTTSHRTLLCSISTRNLCWNWTSHWLNLNQEWMIDHDDWSLIANAWVTQLFQFEFDFHSLTHSSVSHSHTLFWYGGRWILDLKIRTRRFYFYVAMEWSLGEVGSVGCVKPPKFQAGQWKLGIITRSREYWNIKYRCI